MSKFEESHGFRDGILDELREAIAGINQGSVQRAFYLVLELLEASACQCKDGLDVQEMYPEQSPAIPMPDKIE